MNRVFWYFQFFSFFVFFSNFTEGENVTSNLTNYTESSLKNLQRPGHRKWITQLMEEAKNAFDIDPEADAQCKKDFSLYQLHLQNQSIWAVRMLESSEWPTVGVYAVMTYSMGNWDECLRISEYNVKGQYCLVNASFDVSKTELNPEFDQSNEKGSAWDALRKFKATPWLVQRQNLHWALCIPHSCKPSDITLSLNSTLQPIFEKAGINIEVDVDAKLCSTRNKAPEFSPGFYIFCGFAGAVVLTVIFCTIWDLYRTQEKDEDSNSKTSFCTSILESFSIPHNMKVLTKPSTESAPAHFMRIVYLISAALGHRLFLLFGNPIFNGEKKELETYTVDYFPFIFRGLFMTDSFSVMSGFFNAYYGYSRVRGSGVGFIFISIILRWMRLVPLFALAFLFVINVLPYLSEGPYWNYRISQEVEYCGDTFWYFMAGVNNIFETNKVCLYTSWYIAVDLQSAIIGDILLYILNRKKSLGIFITGVLFLGSTVACSVVLFVNKYHSILQITDRVISNPRAIEEFTNFYIKTYYRLPLFLLGFVTALLLKSTKLRHQKTTDGMVLLWLVFIVLTKSSVMMYTKQFFEFVEPYDRVKSAMNAVLPRLIFFIPDCWALVMNFTPGNDILNRGLNRHIFTIIGRLMYSFFVVHIILMVYHVSSYQVLLPTFSNLPVVWIFGADVFFSLIASLIIHLLFEAPITNFLRMALKMIVPENSSKVGEAQNKNDEAIDMNENNLANLK